MKKVWIVLGVILLFLLFWVGSVVKCEVLTSQYGTEFLQFEEVATAMKYKVLSYSADSARVYCVNFDGSNGTVHRYAKQDGDWQYARWEAGGWSTSGSADRSVWPYIWDYWCALKNQ